MKILSQSFCQYLKKPVLILCTSGDLNIASTSVKKILICAIDLVRTMNVILTLFKTIICHLRRIVFPDTCNFCLFVHMKILRSVSSREDIFKLAGSVERE